MSQIPVTDEFRISLSLVSADIFYDSEDDEAKVYQNRRDKLEKRYTTLVRDLMLPDTLRKELTEKSLCLESRPQPPPLPVKTKHLSPSSISMHLDVGS